MIVKKSLKRNGWLLAYRLLPYFYEYGHLGVDWQYMTEFLAFIHCLKRTHICTSVHMCMCMCTYVCV